MSRFAAFLLITAIVAPGLAHAQGNGVHYELIIACPGSPILPTPGGGCPVRATDEDDMMGDPAVAVDPDVPERLVIASLHNSGDTGGPTVRSRCCNQPFTTFTSSNAGATWTDNPFPAPDRLNNAYGEHPAITIDPFGHLYVGSLYATPTEQEDFFRYVIAAQKFSGLQDVNQNQDGEYHVEYVTPIYDGNRINQMWFLFNPAQDHMYMVWHEETTPYSSSAVPPSRMSSPVLDARLNALPLHAAGLAQAQPSPNGSNGAKDTIGITWSGSHIGDPYHYQSRENGIHPCSEATNPVLSDGFVYVGCVVAPDKGEFRWEPDIEPETVAVFRLHPEGGEPQYLGASPIVGGHPKLGVRSDGRLALAATSVEGDVPALAVSFGSYKGRTGLVDWSNVASYGDRLDVFPSNTDILDVRIQDMIYREHSGVIQLIVKHVIDPGTVSLGAVYAPRIHKSVVAIDEGQGFLARLDLDIGNLLNRTDPTLLAGTEMIYNDLSDDFLQLPPGPFEYEGKSLGATYEREFFAVGDYGTVIFAELIEDTELRGPAAVPPPAQAIPLAAPSTSLSVAQVLLPAAGISVAALMAAAFVVNRRKSPMAAYAKSK